MRRKVILNSGFVFKWKHAFKTYCCNTYMLLLVFQWMWNDLEHVDSVHNRIVSSQMKRTTDRQEVVLKTGRTALTFTMAILKTISLHSLTKKKPSHWRTWFWKRRSSVLWFGVLLKTSILGQETGTNVYRRNNWLF